MRIEGYGILLGRRGVEDEDGTLGRVVEGEERGYELGEAEAGGEDYKAAGRVLEEVGDYVLVELYHRKSPVRAGTGKEKWRLSLLQWSF